MEAITREVVSGLLAISSKETKPIALLTEGVKLLQDKPIPNNIKKQLLKVIIKQIAYGADGVQGTFDDLLSENTLAILIELIETDIVDTVIDGVVANFKKADFKTLFAKCGILVRWKPFR